MNYEVRIGVIAIILAGGILAGGCASQVKDVAVNTTVYQQDIAGTYGTMLPAADGQKRVIRLGLQADGRAELSLDFLNDRPVIMEVGKWESDKAGRVVVTLLDRDRERPRIFAFALQDGELTVIEYDRSDWGREGFRLKRQPEVTGRVWRLVQIRLQKDIVAVPSDPGRYTLELGTDGRVAALADCNRLMGRYILAGTSLTFQRLASTRAMCPNGSLFNQYSKSLEAAISCELRDGILTIGFADDGEMVFEPVPQAPGAVQ
jgi:heat shock protein HslJ